MIKDFAEIMSQRTDKQLAEMLTLKRDDYQAEALAAAQIEFDKRNLNANEILTETDIKKAEEEANSLTIEGRRLTTLFKILTFLSPGYGCVLIRLLCISIEAPILSGLALPVIIFAQILILNNLKEKGFVTMALDYKKWLKYSWYFFGTLFVVIFVLELVLRSHSRRY